MQRNGPNIGSKCGHKYELDRNDCPNYMNMSDMYCHIGKEVEDVRLTENLGKFF